MGGRGQLVRRAAAGSPTGYTGGVRNNELRINSLLFRAAGCTGHLTGQRHPQRQPELQRRAARGAVRGVDGRLMQGVSAVVGNVGTVGAIAARTTVQGAVQALMGGNFKDGAIAGLASGLAEAAAGHLNAGIDQAVLDTTMTAAEGFAAHSFARVIGSAIRAAASPGDPGQAFASAFLDDVFRQVGPPGAGQQLNPTVDAGGAPIATTPEPPVPGVDGQAPAVEGTNLAGNPATVIPPSDPFSTIRDDAELTRRELLAEQLGVPVESIVDVGLRDYAGRSTDVFLGFIEGAGFSALATGEALVEIAKSPRQFIDGVKTLLTSPEARAQFGNEIVMRVKVDLQMLEDAFNSGDMRGTGQQLGKLTTDLAQVAGGVEALARLGVSAGSAGGRLLLRSVDDLAATRLIAGTRGGAISVDQAATGIQWGNGIEAQGMPWENYLATKLPVGSRLPPNFNTFDFFDDISGVATSAKSLDTLTPAKLANPSQIYSSLRGNIDAVADFESARLSNTIVKAEEISQRVLEVAIPAGTTPAQWDQIAKAIQYGQGRGVIVKVTQIKP